MSLYPITMNRLETGQRAVLHVEAILPALLVAAGGAAAALALRDRLEWADAPVALLASAVALYLLLVSPRRRWAARSWALEQDALHVAHGVWTRYHTVVPLGRVQHIDVAQRPVERAFGVARLILHTAGTSHAVVVLPGLSRATAEQLRDAVRAHMRAETW